MHISSNLMHNRIALVDWDGTIRKGFTIKEWCSFLVQLYGERHLNLTKAIDDLFSSYQNQGISHDQLAVETAQAYATFVAGLPTEELKYQALRFATEDSGNLFTYASGVFELLRAFNIKSFVVSGCPSIILECYKSIMDFDDFFGLCLAQENERYTGRVESNPGVSIQKKRIVTDILLPNSSAEVAFGNSVSDMPLFDMSAINVIVNNKDLEVPGHKIVAFDGFDLTGALRSAISQRI